MLCILCMTTSQQVINIFDEDGSRLNICSIISQHFWLQPSKSNFEQVICTSCWDALNSFHQFYERVKEAHNTLLNVELDPQDEVKGEIIFTDDLVYASSNDLLVTGIKAENCDDPSNEDIETRVNPLEVIERTDEIVEGRKWDLESEIVLSKLAEYRQSSKKNKATDFDSNSVLKKRSRKKDACSTDIKEPKTEERMQAVSSARETKFSNDEVINQNMKLLCDICHISLENFSDLQSHFHSLHNTRGYVACCDRKFDKRNDLADHILLHKNPEHFKCDQCGKVVTNRRGLSEHKRMVHEKQFIYECDKCNKKFHRKLNLDRHMDIHIEDRSFQCEQCEKFFTSKMTLRQHIYSVHKHGYRKVCEQCGKITPDIKAFRRHMLDHTNEPKPFVNCEKCGVKLSDKNALQRHMKRVHTESNVSHVCSFCGTIATSIYALKRHVTYMHKYERSHKCPMCGKGFKRALTLKKSFEHGFTVCLIDIKLDK